MPRGRKRIVPIEEEIESIYKNIESLEKRLNSQKEQLQKLTTKKKEADVEELMRIIDKNNLSIREIIKEISPTRTKSDNPD